jgi:LmbE family N-acetylglucosaminyl deacetylase
MRGDPSDHKLLLAARMRSFGQNHNPGGFGPQYPNDKELHMEVKDSKCVLAIGAHPDDLEILCAGTLALLRERGWKIACATMTPGDVGSATLSREEISAIRKAEAAASARLLDADYHCMGSDDIFIAYDRPTLVKVIALIRQLKPTIVFTMSPQDYMIDHEVTSDVVRTACFSAGIRNVPAHGTDPLSTIPYLFYSDPIDGKDKFGTEIKASTIVNISGTMQLKEKMFRCHESQASWLKSHHGIDDYVNASLKELSAKRGVEIGAAFAEGFRQHLGHAFPQDNILREELTSLVHVA